MSTAKVGVRGKDDTCTMDESYTIAENLFLAYQNAAGDRDRCEKPEGHEITVPQGNINTT